MSFFKRLVPLKAQMALNLENISVAEGTPFKGSAVLSSDDNFQVEHVRMEVRVWEKYREDEWVREGNQQVRRTVEKKDTRYSQDVIVSQPFSATKGSRTEYPFEVTMPRYMPARANGAIIYSLKAVADVKGRPDVTKEINPSILPAPPQVIVNAPANPVITVRCAFHGGMITLAPGMTACPSCGAPLGSGSAVASGSAAGWQRAPGFQAQAATTSTVMGPGDPGATCVCGHVQEDHDYQGKCGICKCARFSWAGNPQK